MWNKFLNYRFRILIGYVLATPGWVLCFAETLSQKSYAICVIATERPCLSVNVLSSNSVQFI